MWYEGGHATAAGVGYANSTDGIVWKKYPLPVLLPGPPGSWDSARVEVGSVLWNGTLFLMAYRGVNQTTFSSGAIGVAGSKDGITWVKYSNNPVLTPGSLDQAIGRPFAIRWHTTYSMWYAGRSANVSARIFYATSTDGITWTKWPSVVFSPSSYPNAWDSGTVTAPDVIQSGLSFGLWYTGINQGGITAQIGYATSMDGRTWNRTSLNPVLTVGSSGSWDAAGVEQPGVVQSANGYVMYYDGFNQTSSQRIGLAYAPQNFNVPEFAIPQIGILVTLLACATACYARRKR
jgi:predicted GH43/DUF377 family glycosyl hydrolase